MDHGSYKTFRKKKGENLPGSGLGKDILNLTPKAIPIKEKIDKLNFINIKTIYSMKALVRR